LIKFTTSITLSSLPPPFKQFLVGSIMLFFFWMCVCVCVCVCECVCVCIHIYYVLLSPSSLTWFPRNSPPLTTMSCSCSCYYCYWSIFLIWEKTWCFANQFITSVLIWTLLLLILSFYNNYLTDLKEIRLSIIIYDIICHW
jgi:hypothetical protein